MATPRLEIALSRIVSNAKAIKELYNAMGIIVFGVTKVACGSPEIANALVSIGLNILADSKISNLKKMHDQGVNAQFVLLRTPLMSQLNDVVEFSDISLNSELLVVQKLSQVALKLQLKHKIILMVELGDLREGIMPADLEDIVSDVLMLEGIELIGIGANLACFGGVEPDENKMRELSAIADRIEAKFNINLEYISGGNSANHNWTTKTKDVQRINNLRIGEAIFLGCETLDRKPIPGLHTDIFTLVAEVIELKTKPSLPFGSIHQNVWGDTPHFEDQGIMKRAILGIGMQDVAVSGLTPLIDIEIIGTSSDHVIVDAKHADLTVGSEVSFELNYTALLSAMTSPYVTKIYN
jgi:predicted amino acid racemase